MKRDTGNQHGSDHNVLHVGWLCISKANSKNAPGINHSCSRPIINNHNAPYMRIDSLTATRPHRGAAICRIATTAMQKSVYNIYNVQAWISVLFTNL